MKTLTVQTREAIHQLATLRLSITRIQSKSLNSFKLKSIKHDRSSRSSNQIQEAHGSHSSLAPNSNLPKSLSRLVSRKTKSTRWFSWCSDVSMEKILLTSVITTICVRSGMHTAVIDWERPCEFDNLYFILQNLLSDRNVSGFSTRSICKTTGNASDIFLFRARKLEQGSLWSFVKFLVLILR